MKNSELPKAKKYSQVVPDFEDWPIVQLNKIHNQFGDEVLDKSITSLSQHGNGVLLETLERTLFVESIRLREQRWSTDPEDDENFWKGIREELLTLSQKDSSESKAGEEKLLHDIISRYVHEIESTFNISSYRFAQRMLTIGFYPLLNAPVYLNFLEKQLNVQVQKRIQLSGDLELIRKLAKNCTLILVPTHFSNLDSITVAWAIRTLGLPAFLYGAGQNLFGIKLLSFFMNRLGAYKVDRRKKNALYLETLKTYSTLAIHKGCHTMFFPYGERSLSGSIETKLKLGLLGTAMDAQYMNIQKAENNGTAKKVIIVPVVLNYHFVLEAPFLIDEYLKTTGRENYLIDENDRYSTSFELLKTAAKLFTQDTEFQINFGQCMDVFGNPVDDEGRSKDGSGREINIRDYFVSRGELKQDKQRNSEYVRMLGKKLAASYLQENTVFSSHLVSFVAFELLKIKKPKMDIYDLMRLTEDERVIQEPEFMVATEKVLKELKSLASENKIKLASHLALELGWNLEKIIAHGIRNAGIYHPEKVLSKNKQGQITVVDMKLVYYYHNRLNGYGLEKVF